MTVCWNFTVGRWGLICQFPQSYFMQSSRVTHFLCWIYYILIAVWIYIVILPYRNPKTSQCRQCIFLRTTAFSSYFLTPVQFVNQQIYSSVFRCHPQSLCFLFSPLDAIHMSWTSSSGTGQQVTESPKSQNYSNTRCVPGNYRYNEWGHLSWSYRTSDILLAWRGSYLLWNKLQERPRGKRPWYFLAWKHDHYSMCLD